MNSKIQINIILLCLFFLLGGRAIAQTITMANGSTTACSGTFYDSGGNGGAYGNSQTLVFTICPSTPGSQVTANFTTFALENSWDFLYIYDGNSTGAPTLGTYTGTTGPGLVSATLGNATGCLTFRFTSDGTVNAAGWAATIACTSPCPTINSGIASTTPAASGGFVRLCQGGSVSVTATAASGGTGPYTYAWNWGDGTANGSGINASHTYAAAGSYIISLVATASNGCATTVAYSQVVQVSTTPTINTNAAPNPICLGQSSNLTAAVTMNPYVPNCTPPVSGTTFLPDGSGVSYTTSINVNCFNSNQTITAASNISNVCLSLEHSYLGDLNLVLICPNGQSMVLKAYPGGNGTYLGSPLDDPAVGPGTGANYCFTPGASTLLVNGTTTTSGSPSGNSIVAGNYMPVNPFTNLIGCPLNGAWTIQVTDNLGSDNGYIFNWDVNFTVPAAAGGFTPTIASQGWQATTGLTSTGATTATVTPTAAGTPCYTYAVTDNFGCTYTQQQCITVNPNTPVSAGPDRLICGGGSTTLAGSGAATYTWSPATGLSATNVASPTASPATTTTYTVTGTSAAGCVTTDQVLVTVSANPTIAVNSGSYCAGGSLVLNATGGTTYSWSPATGLSATTGASVTASPAGTTAYTVTGTNAAGCTSTAIANVTVNPIPTVNAGADQTVCAGTAVTLAGSGASTYSWNNGVTNGVAFTPAVGSVTYTVTGTSAAGCTNTDQVVVTVNAVPVVNAGPDVSICASQSTTLTASGATTYTWSPATGLSATTGASVTATPASTQTYTVTGTTAGCTSTDAVTVTVGGSAAINAGPDVAICNGGSTNLTATGGVTYTWSPATGLSATNIANPTANPTTTQTYTVTGTNASGCLGTDQVVVTVNPIPTINAGADVAICNGASTNLTATGGSTYTWSPATGLSATNVANPTANPTTTQTYTVTGTTAAGCINTDQVVVTVNPLPTVNAGTDQSVCTGTSVTLTGTGASVYTWNNGVTNGVAFTPASTQTYTVTGTSAAGCINTDQVVVTVLTTAPINAGPDVAICNGASTNLTATGGVTYVWSPATGLSATNIANPIASPTATQTYTVVGTDANGCTGTDQVIVTVNPIPTINAGADVAICNGASTNLSASGGATYTWSPATGLSATNIANPTANPTSTQTYTVTGTSAAGCISTDQVVVTVNPLPVVNAGVDQTVCAGTSVTLNGSGAAVYTWNNGVTDGVAFTPAATLTYTVTGTTAAGCTSTDQVLVTVNPLPTINAGADVAICNGASTNLAATGGATYTWSPATGLSATNIANPTANPTSTQTYTVTGTSAAGCISTDQVIVTVNTIPTINAGADVAICNGASTNLSASGGATYTWSPATGLSATNIANPTANPTSTQTYTVTGTSAAGCISTDQVIVTVNPLPTVGAGPDQTVCAGTAVTLNGSGAVTYTWNNGVSNGVAFTPAATLTYTVTGTDANGCISTDQVVVTVNPLPVVNAGIDQTVCSGTAVTLSGAGAATYTWDNGVTNGVAFTPAVGTVTYTVTGTTAAGCTGTDQVIVTVNPNPTPVIQGPTQYCSGSNAVLSTSTPYTTYTWSTGASTATATVTDADNPITVNVTNAFGCSAISGPFNVIENSVITANFTETICQGQSVLIHGNLESVAGLYSQTYTTVSGCDSVANVTLVVNPLPAVNAGVDQAVCTGTATTLTASGATNYAWDNGITNGVPFTQAVGSVTYTVTGTDLNGCVNTDQAVITVNALPIVGAGPDVAICIGASTTLNGSGASTYTWNNGVTNGTAFSPALTNTYTVTGTDVNGCINTDQVVVTVNALPIVNAGLDAAICAGASTTLSGVGATTYTWDNGVTNGVAFTPAATLTYTVTGTDANSCTNTDQVVVTVNPLPIVNAGVDQTVCSGTSVTLNGSGASTYMWDNGVTDGISFIPSVGTITYTVTGTDGNGCINTDQVVVTVNALPNVGAGADFAICAGATATLSGTGASTYTWNNGVTNAVAFSPALTNTYTVTGTDVNGCINTDQIVVTVNALPAVNAGVDQTTCAGGSVTLAATGASTYTWNNGVTNGIPFTPASTLTYTVTGTDVNGCINSDQVLVTVAGLPVVTAGPDQTICSGTSVTLSGGGASTYTWDNGVTDAVSFTPAVGTLTYTVTGTDAGGCINTDQVVVTVNALPVVGAGTDFAICAGATATLNGSGASTYTWNNGVTNAVAFSPALTNTYTVTGTDLNGCISTDQITVTVNALPVVNAGADQTICAGDVVTLSGSGATTYTWDNGVTNGIPFTPAATLTYTVTGTDVNGCIDTDQAIVTVNPLPLVNAGADKEVCEGVAVTLIATGASTYSWLPLVTNGSPFLPPVGTTVYTVTGTDVNGCTNTDQLTVVVNPNPIVSAGPDQTVCIGASVTLSGSGADTYSWTNGVADGVAFTPVVGTVIYTVTGTTVAGCTGTDQVMVIVNPLPVVFAGNDLEICANQSVTLTASGANTYSWDNGISNAVPFTPAVGTVTYTVTGTDANGCINSDAVDVLVNPNPVVTYDYGVTIGCVPFETTLTSTTVGATNCVWTLSDGQVLTGCGPLDVTIGQAGCFDVTLTTQDANGCTSTMTTPNLFCGENYPIADFTPSENPISMLNTEVYFENTSIGAVTYQWTFAPEGIVSPLENPLFTFPNTGAGQYDVQLIAYSPLGCPDTTNQVIIVEEETIFYVPNTYTPDDDAFNPVFLPIFTAGFDTQDYNMFIYNRWGELIFESHDASIGWDGSYGQNGEVTLCQDGTYTWKIEFKTTQNDKRIMKVGHVNLIR